MKRGDEFLLTSLEQQQFIIKNTETENYSLNIVYYFLENEDYTLFNFPEKILENFNHGYYHIIMVYSEPLLNDVNLEVLYDKINMVKKQLLKTFFYINPKLLIISTNNDMRLDKIETPKGVTIISANRKDELTSNEVIQEIYPELQNKPLNIPFEELTHNINKVNIEYAAKLNKIFNKKRYAVNFSLIFLLISTFIVHLFFFDLMPYFAINRDVFNEGNIYQLLTNNLYYSDVITIIFSTFILFNFGLLIEKIYGSLRYIVIVLMTFITSNALLLAFIDQDTYPVGFVMMIYGLIGAFIYTFLVFRRFLAYTIKRTLYFLVFAVIFFLIFMDFTYFTAMIGALLGGIIASFIVGIPHARNSTLKNRGLSLIYSILLIVLAVSIGLK